MASFTKTVLKAGSGACPSRGSTVTVAADLYLAENNKAIWSTHKPSGFLFSAENGPQPFTYQAGVGGVIKGWDEGVATMQLGERARLAIPWQAAYGAAGHPGFSIPPKAALVFEIEVLKIQ
ncbi:peptidyl-prolyl cis-trans isomerase, FKBP-type [Kipferlia bialata]|uniref:peptidylprolyl isomerase n=1 Tax=Kipferlia bialata TaxID=797122 RepID=A0A391NQL5_9EUKA|nr:peptidyl-prolyl cis-trans isomerase, FKBP-type [Kipferlia bialata]|eukprot:g4030.t1